MTPPDAKAAGAGMAGQFLRQAALAHSRLAAEEHEHSGAGQDVLQRLREAFPLRLAADELWLSQGGHRGPPCGTRNDLVDAVGLAEPFELELPLELVLAPPHSLTELLDRLRSEDLAPFGEGGDAGGDDNGRPEEIRLLLYRLAGVKADADHEFAGGLLPVVLGDGPLNSDRAGQSRGGALEGDHEAVAHRLHFGTAVAAHLFPHQGVVDAQDLLGPLIAQGFGQLGRSYEVREQEGDNRLPSDRGHRLNL